MSKGETFEMIIEGYLYKFEVTVSTHFIGNKGCVAGAFKCISKIKL